MLDFLDSLIIPAVAVFLSLSLHEAARAYISFALGDKRPKHDGRLTLNPINHFEPIGFIICFLTGCGWGKPVITNSMFYKNRKIGSLITAIGPSIVNLIFAFTCGCIYIYIGHVSPYISILLVYLVRYNVSVAVYNVIPASPFDGLKVMSVFMHSNTYFKYLEFEKIVQIGFILLLFTGFTDPIFNPIIAILMKVCGV